MPTRTASRARVLMGACLTVLTVTLLVASYRQRTMATSSVIAKLATETPEEGRLYWLASGQALRSCAEFTYFIRRIGLDARTRGTSSVLITESDSVEDIVDRRRLPVELTAIPGIELPDDSLVIVLVQPGISARTFALGRVDAGTRPGSMLGEMRTWLMRASVPSPVASEGHRE